MIQQVLFIIVCILAFGYAVKQLSAIKNKIFLGKDEDLDIDKSKALSNMFLVAFGQKKMFKRIVPAILHLFIYVAFMLTQIELIEILIDGVFGTHRVLSFLGPVYDAAIGFFEILAVLVFVSHIPRFTGGWFLQLACIKLYLIIFNYIK